MSNEHVETNAWATLDEDRSPDRHEAPRRSVIETVVEMREANHDSIPETFDGTVPGTVGPAAEGEELWEIGGPTAWEATLQQEEELLHTYPGGKDEFFARLWDEPSTYDLETFGPLCGVSLVGQSKTFAAPEAGSSPSGTVEGLRTGALSPRFVSADVVAAVVRERPRDLWLRGDWEDIVRQHGGWALDLAERVKTVEAHRAANRLRRAIITEDSVAIAPTVHWLVENMFVSGELVAIVGRRYAGKTTLAAVDLACCVATGTPWLGRRVRHGRALVLVAEGTQVEFQARVRAWRAGHPDAGDPWANLIPVVERINFVPDHLASTGSEGEAGDARDVGDAREAGDTGNDGDPGEDGESGKPSEDREGSQAADVEHHLIGGLSSDAKLAVELIGEEGPALVVIDSVAACLGARPNLSHSDVTSVLEAMHAMAEVVGSTVVVLHHSDDHDPNPAAVQFEDGVDTIAHLKSRRNSTERFVECSKPSRTTREWQTVKLRLVPRGDVGIFMPTPASDTDVIHRALSALGAPAGKSAILQQAREVGFSLDRNRALRLIDELADDPDDLVARDGIRYFLEGPLE